MSKVFMWVMCSEEAIDAHGVADVVAPPSREATPRVPRVRERWAKKTRERPAPKYPLEPREEKEKVEEGRGRGGSAALILARRDASQGQAEDLFASLEAKYGGKRRARPRRRVGVEKKTKKKMNR